MTAPRFLGQPDPEPDTRSRDVPSKGEATAKLAAVLASGGGAAPLTTALAAAFLGMHNNTLKRLGGRGEGPPYHVINTRGDRRYRLRDLIEWQEGRTTDRPEPPSE
jgi:hypothetical protein